MFSQPEVPPPSSLSASAPPVSGGEEGAWLHMAAEAVSGLAWISVLAVLVTLLLRRRDLLDAWIGGVLVLFLLAGGLGQVLRASTGDGDADIAIAFLQALSAAGALVAAVALWPLLPRLLALANPTALAREVEERRAAERRAVESEQRARASEGRMADFLANLPEAICVIRVPPGGPFCIEAVNPAFERMFGVPALLASGARPEAVLPPGLLATALPAWRSAAARGETLDYEAVADLPAGRRSLQTVLVPLRGADGRVDRLLGSTRDVTATRRLQQGLAQSARLATVGTMCAGLAHEASQPLNVATLWLRRVRVAARDLPQAQQAPVLQAAQVVDDQLRRAGDLIGRIRALAAEDPRAAERFDATEPVAAALRLAAARCAAEGITLSLEGGGGSLEVRGSAARLEQAVLQLLSNARDAVLERRRREPLAPARIEVTLREAAGVVAVEVRDSGTGVPEGLAAAIFDPFFTTKEPGRGSGLGLAFAAGVARAMGGGIQTWNLPGGGACFRMELATAEPRPVRRGRFVAA